MYQGGRAAVDYKYWHIHYLTRAYHNAGWTNGPAGALATGRTFALAGLLCLATGKGRAFILKNQNKMYILRFMSIWILKPQQTRVKHSRQMFPLCDCIRVSFRGQTTVSVGSPGYQPRTHKQIFHNRKSHDFDSHECGGAKVKGVEETVGVEADPVNSMGWVSSAAPGIWELCNVRMQSATKAMMPHVKIRRGRSEEGKLICDPDQNEKSSAETHATQACTGNCCSHQHVSSEKVDKSRGCAGAT